jgi:hypothetical protein
VLSKRFTQQIDWVPSRLWTNGTVMLNQIGERPIKSRISTAAKEALVTFLPNLDYPEVFLCFLKDSSIMKNCFDVSFSDFILFYGDCQSSTTYKKASTTFLKRGVHFSCFTFSSLNFLFPSRSDSLQSVSWMQ